MAHRWAGLWGWNTSSEGKGLNEQDPIFFLIIILANNYIPIIIILAVFVLKGRVFGSPKGCKCKEKAKQPLSQPVPPRGRRGHGRGVPAASGILMAQRAHLAMQEAFPWAHTS